MTDSDSLIAPHNEQQARQPDCVGAVSDLRHSHIERAHAVMTVAFIRWHLLGDFMAAADYQKARRAWEVAVMDATDQPKGDK